jgi:hypothetical protein
MSGASNRTRLLFERLHEDAELLAARLRDTHVELSLIRPSPADEIACALATTLLLRLADDAPHVHLVAPEARVTRVPRLDDEPLFDALVREHEGFASLERFHRSSSDDATIKIAFGGGDGIGVTSTGWACGVGVDVDKKSDGNPLAAAFSGVLGANEAFKASLVAAGLDERRAPPWRGTLSLWDYSDSWHAGPELAEPIDLSHFGLVGCGGIGSATAFTLALLPIFGSPSAVDRDEIDETNLNRHLTAGYREIGSAKAKLVGAMLDAAGATTLVRTERWQTLTPEERAAVEVPIVSVDHDPTRRDIQLELPRLILNAGTSDDGLYQVTRHDFINNACLCCIARADQIVSSLEENVARYLGIAHEEFLALSHSREALPQSVLERIREDERERLRDVPAHEITRVVCGRLQLPSAGPAVSAPTLSAAPGVLLAVETVKLGRGADTPLSATENAIVGSVLRGPHGRWLMQRRKRPDCVCDDELYRSYYQRKWITQSQEHAPR